ASSLTVSSGDVEWAYGLDPAPSVSVMAFVLGSVLNTLKRNDTAGRTVRPGRPTQPRIPGKNHGFAAFPPAGWLPTSPLLTHILWPEHYVFALVVRTCPYGRGLSCPA